ncbi:SppA periplasmic serine protease [Microcystis phage Mae-JY24]
MKLTAPPSGVWAIEPREAQGLLASARMMAGRDKVRVEVEEEEYNPGGWAEPTYQLTERGDAIVALRGPMTKHATCMTWMMGGASTKECAAAIRAVDADERARRIILLVDSPGGEVAGTADLARVVRECQKPTVAYIEDMGCSAAYWVASQAGEVVCGPTAMVGSIGVITVVADWSVWMANEGLALTEFKTGEHKHVTPTGLTDAQAAGYQELVDSLFAVFRADVTAARTVDDAVFDARVVVGDEAVALGLVDRVAALDDVLGGDEPPMAGGVVPAVETPAAEAAQNMDNPNIIQKVSAALGIGKAVPVAHTEEDALVAQIEQLKAKADKAEVMAEASAREAFAVRLDAQVRAFLTEGRISPAAKDAVTDHLRDCYEADNGGTYADGREGKLYASALALMQAYEPGIQLQPMSDSVKKVESVDDEDTKSKAKAFNDLAKPKGL